MSRSTQRRQGRPGVMPARCGRNQARVAHIEQEFQMPLAQVLEAFASDGESPFSTAAILEIPYATFRQWPEVRAQKWPAPGRSNAARSQAGSPARRTPAIVAAARANLVLARAIGAEKR